MKIVHICLGNFYIEGMAYQENVLPKKHADLGYDVSIIASRYNFTSSGNLNEKDVGEYINSDGIKVIVLDYALDKKNARKFKLYEGLYDTLEKENPDILFCHGVQFHDVTEIVRFKKSHPTVKIYADNHGDYINARMHTGSKFLDFKHRIVQILYWRPCAKKLEKVSEVIWGVTPLRVRFLQDVYNVRPEHTALLVMGGDEEKIHFNGQNEIRSQLRSQWNIPQDAFLVVTGGKIDRKKNIHFLLEVVQSMTDKSIHLVVFGEPDSEMKPIVDKFKETANIHMIGWIPSEQAYDWFLTADLAVFPGTHSVLWEQAVASGLPCVFKHWDGMEHVDAGGNCRFLYKDSVKEITDVLLEIHDNPEMYMLMKRAAMEKGVPMFSYREIAKRAIGISEGL